MEDINSSSKRFKDLKEARCSDDGVDRISDLPDLVLLHILSFLPTNDSVGTSVLSHRWRYLFTRVSKFDFDQSLFPRSDPYAYDERYHYPYLRAGVKCPSSLKDFVDRVLLVWDSSHISSFRLKCRPAFDCSNIDVWIVFALRRGVAELDIFTYEDKLSILPPSLFSCKTLVVLKLRGGFQMKFPKSFKLPKLKTLQLSTVKFEDDYSLNRLLSGCPLLEDLVLLGGWEDVEDLIVSSPSVRRFTLDCSDGFLSESFHRSSISLDLPNLLYFNYVDYLAIHYILKNVNSVKEARIDILSDLDGMMCETQKFCTAFRELVNGFSAAKLLFLGGTCLKVLKFCKNGLPTFNSLIRLDLGCARHVSFRGSLPDLLNSAPNLEILVFSEGILQCERDDDFDDDKTHWSRQRKAPPCLSRMKLIILHLFHGYNEELRIAKYLLRHGKGLQMLVLDWITTTHDNDIKHAKEFRKLKKLADSKGCMLANLKMWSDYGMALELDG